MYFRSLFKTRLFRPIVYGLSHPNTLLLSGFHWMKCAPVNPYFYMFSTQKQQSKRGSVKVHIENSNTKGEAETQVKDQKELQKEVKTQDERPNEFQQKLVAIYKKLQKEVEVEGKELQRQIKAVMEVMVEEIQKKDRNMEIMVEEIKKRDQNMEIMVEEIKKKDQNIEIMVEEIKKRDRDMEIMIEEIKKKDGNKQAFSLSKIATQIFLLAIAGIAGILLNKFIPAIWGIHYYAQSKQLSAEVEDKGFVDEYIETSSRATLKEMLINSDKQPSKQILYISGVPGIGKTTSINKVIQQMKKENYQICYFRFNDDTGHEIVNQILCTISYLRLWGIYDNAKHKKRFIIVDQINRITAFPQGQDKKIIQKRRQQKEDIIKLLSILMDTLGYNIVLISSDFNFFEKELQTVKGVRSQRYKFLNFNQPSIRQMIDYLKCLKSSTNPALKIDEVMITHLVQNYSTFRGMSTVLKAYFAISGDRATALQASKFKMNLSKRLIQKNCEKNDTQLSQKDIALYKTCLQKSISMPVDKKFYDQLNQNNILNEKHFRSLENLRGFELYYNENPSKFEKNLPQKVKEQFKDHKIHCKEVFLDRPAN